MWGGGKGSGWNRTQNQAWGQYNDRQEKDNPWQQQSQGGGGWNQSGGGRSTRAANAWDANAYKRSATGGGGGGGWGGGGTTYRGPSQQQAQQLQIADQARAQQGQGYSDWLSGAGSGYQSMTNTPQAHKAYQQYQRQGREWESEQRKMEQEMARRDHQRGLQESPETMMQMFQIINQMKDYFPEGWADEFWTRMMWGYMPKAVQGYGKPKSVEQYINLGGFRRM